MLDVASSIIQVISWGYVVTQLKEKKINIKSIKNILLVIVMILGVLGPLTINVGFSKTIISYSIFTICFKYIYNISFYESSILNFISIALHFIGELLVTLLLVLLKIDISTLEKYMYLNPMSGLSVFFVIVVLFLIFKKKLISFNNHITTQNNSNVFYMIIVLCFSILFSINISKWQNENMMSNILTIIIFGLIVIFLFIEKFKVLNSNKTFEQLFKQSQNVSTLLEKHQKVNHEIKNDLRVLKSITKENDVAQEYIEEILLEKNIIDNDKWITEFIKINDRVLNSFLSMKINEIVDNDIKVFVNISNKIKDYDFSTLKTKEYKDLYRILGVYLDNAYQASKESIEKEVTFEMNSTNNGIEFIISNSFLKEIDINKLGIIGYTTKGSGHGIGLSIVKDIISKSQFIAQKTTIIDNYFYQYLYLETQNKKNT